MKIAKAKRSNFGNLRWQILGFVTAACVAGGTIYASYVLSEDVASMSAVESTYNQLVADIQAKGAESDTLSASIDSTGKSLSGSFMSKDEFIAFLGETSSRLGLSLTKYSGGELTEKDGIATVNFTFEVSGELYQLENMVQCIDYLGTPYAINGISYRKADEYIWLDRDIDKTKVVKYWDGKSIEYKKPYTEVLEPEPIGTGDIMSGTQLKMYLDVSFISSKDKTVVDAPKTSETPREQPPLKEAPPKTAESSSSKPSSKPSSSSTSSVEDSAPSQPNSSAQSSSSEMPSAPPETVIVPETSYSNAPLLEPVGDTYNSNAQ